MSLSSINIVLGAITEAYNASLNKAADVMDRVSKRMQSSADTATKGVSDAFGSGKLRQSIEQVSDIINEQKQIYRDLSKELEDLRNKRDMMSKSDVQGQKAVRAEIEKTKNGLKEISRDTAELTAKKQALTAQLGATNQQLGGTRAALNGLATSFSAVSSVVGIMADDNKALRNTLMGLNAALNFSAAIMQVKDLQEQFGGLTKFLSNPWVIAAVAVAGATAAIYAYNTSISQAERIQREVNDELDKATRSARSNAVTLRGYLAIVNDTTQSEEKRHGALLALKDAGIAVDDINMRTASGLKTLNERTETAIQLTTQKAIADLAAGKIAEIELRRIEQLNNLRRDGASFMGRFIALTTATNAVQNEANAINSEAKQATALYTEALNNAQNTIAGLTEKTDVANNSQKNYNKELKDTAKIEKEIEESAKSAQKAQQDFLEWVEKKRFEVAEKAQKKAKEEAKTIQDGIKKPVYIDVRVNPTSFSQVAKDIQKVTQALNAAFATLQAEAAASFGQFLGDLISGEQEAGKNFGKNMLGAIASFMDSLGKALVATAIASEAFQKLILTNPMAAAGAGIALIAGAAIVRNSLKEGPNVTAFADGGIVSGPTLGLMGEYPGARTNPEVIAPLDKLQKLIKPTDSGAGFVASTHVSGRDLAIVLERYNKDSRRG